MKILIDIGHPAHVHYFKNLIWDLDKKGYKIIITARNKDITFALLNEYGLEYIDRGYGSDSLIGKLTYLIKTNFRLYRILKKDKPDLFIGFGSPYAAQVAYLLQKPSIILDDTENAKFGHLFYKYFASLILSPNTFIKNLSSNHQKYNGYMELCYLHPNYFSPNPNILIKLNLKKDEKFAILRFVSWKANHDIGHKGISFENKLKAVKEFSKYGKVLISSETPLPKELENFRFILLPTEMHDAVFYADLIFGESATMASEAAVLGTHAIYLDNVGRGYTTEQENEYDLVYNFTESHNDQLSAIAKGINILKDNSSKKNAQLKRQKLLNSKIDVTKYLIDIVESYLK